jgi:uncharacterized membrane protein YphA (DoxX/SURF4 family)
MHLSVVIGDNANHFCSFSSYLSIVDTFQTKTASCDMPRFVKIPLLLTIYLWFLVILPWLSSVLYIFFPGETMKYFGGTPTPSGEFWVQVVASGDIVIGFLALVGLKTRNNEVLQLVLEAIAVYNIFHMSTFWYDHLFRKSHPKGPASYIIPLVSSIMACVWWGWWKPHQFNTNKPEIKEKK